MISKKVMAQVTLTPNGQLTAQIDPGVPPEQRAMLAVQCAEMFARIASQALMEEMKEAKPQILVPTVGFRL